MILENKKVVIMGVQQQMEYSMGSSKINNQKQGAKVICTTQKQL